MSNSLLSLLPAGLAVEQVVVHPDRVVVAVRARAATASCPLCRRRSRRVHSRYIRHLGDLPWQGRIGHLDLQVRRFRCSAPGCPRRIFAERLPEVALPRVRRTVRLAEAQRRIALHAGGESGARLADRLAMPVSGDTLLRLIRAAPLPVAPSPRVVGIDDWAWRRGRRYGTLIVDLERSRPIDLLPDRDGETVAAWLKAHPGVEIVARDRAGAYADGARTGAPDAVQVADRWHLLRNLGDALAGVLDRHHRAIRTATKAATAVTTVPVPNAPPESRPLTRSQQRTLDKRAARQARFEEVAALNARGWSQSAISRSTGLDRATIRTWLRAGRPPSWSKPAYGSTIDRHAEYLRQRWAEGCTNTARLWREIRDRGYSGRPKTVQEWVRRRLRGTGAGSADAASSATAWKAPSGRRAAWLVVADADEIDDTAGKFVEALLAGSPDLTAVIALAREFRTMVRERRADGLDPWLAAAQGTALAGFAGGLKRDLAAVRAGLSLSWSSGPVEGQVSRLKTIKRTMCGRAGFDLLRYRVLEAA
ncbi:ISL3 family transposase (plasmid) [Skermanella mucosa]|uniref:ISL3 family transposase n=1 Tax=Skermanella mucosa TaxID=1789672 RepID=UPI001E2C500F|nr:ISL3 family transposase [Skermanella mucosa]UEM20785.1 ISL3 family transposase [Skermanella mucosa]UEM25179.1 ISL3 family transposase [Skermanella mucosa]